MSEAMGSWIFSDTDEASRAKDALIDAGIPPSDVHINVISDEAAPPSGNFALEYKDAGHSNDDSVLDRLFSKSDINEGQGRQPVQWQSVCAVVVAGTHTAEAQRIKEIMEKFDARHQE